MDIVRNEGIVVEMMLSRPKAIESFIGGDFPKAQFLFPHLTVRPAFPAITREDHHHSNIHGNTP